MEGRRSRSLSRFPPPTPGGSDETPRGRFVNKARGSGQTLFNDSRTGEVNMSLDDLADEFLRAREESEEDDDVAVPVRRGRAVERRISLSNNSGSSKGSESSSGARYLKETASSKQRGRSVSRPPAVSRKNHQSVGPTRAHYSSVTHQDETNILQGYNNNPKPTVVRKASISGPTRQNQLQKQNNSNRGSVSRSLSRKSSFHSHDSSSTHSSLTDDEVRDGRSRSSNTSEKTIHAVYATKEHAVSEGESGLYEVMRMEVRNAVEEIRTQLEKVMTKPEASDNKTAGNEEIQPIQVIAELRRNYTSKLEESEMRKQELLAELAAEEQRGNELTQIVKELLPSPQKNLPIERPSRSRRRSRERTRVSRHLTEEAERYFEDFLSNVDDTDFSSFDGERSDTSSFNPKPNCTHQEFQENGLINSPNLVNPKPNYTLQELQQSPVINNNSSSETEADGVVLPWLQWETTPSPSKTLNQGGNVRSSHDSWSPENGKKSAASISTIKSMSKFGEMKNYANGSINKIKRSSFCKDDYLDLRNSEEFLFERLRQRKSIESGRVLFCRKKIL